MHRSPGWFSICDRGLIETPKSIVSEARRKHGSKRIEFHFRVIVCYNTELRMINISKADLVYNHNSLEPSEDYAWFFHMFTGVAMCKDSRVLELRAPKF